MRPDAQLFLHVLSAMTLFGAFGAVAVMSVAGHRLPARPRLAQAAFATLLFAALPAWVGTFAFGSWTKSKEAVPDGTGWVQIGSGVASAGVVVLLVAIAISWSWTRKPGSRWQPLSVGVLSGGYLAALAVTWWVMTAKVPS